MPAINGKHIASMLESKGSDWTLDHLGNALEDRTLSPDDFSFKDIFENVVPNGREMVRFFNPNSKSGGFVRGDAREAADAISSSMFSNIIGQLIYNKIMANASGEENYFSQLVPNVTTMFNGERIPGLGDMGDTAGEVQEGKPYPMAGLSEDWQDTPITVKRGHIAPVTKEAIFFDRTSMVLRSAGEVGTWLGTNKEKRLIDALIDASGRTTAHRHKWRGTSYANFQASTPWINLKTSNALADFASINLAEQQVAGLTDPNTKEPMPLLMTDLIVTPENRANAYRILNTSAVTQAAGGFNAASTVYQSISPSPVGNTPFSSTYRVICSRLLAARMTLNSAEPTTSWLTARVAEALVYMQNWPITVQQATGDSQVAFERDIVAQFKASERGAAYVIQPRYLQINRA